MASTSTSASFYTHFQALKSTIDRHIDSGDFATAARSLTTLKADLRDVSSSLPTYDQRSYDLQIRELDNRLAAARPKTNTKPKFSLSKPKAALPVVQPPNPNPTETEDEKGSNRIRTGTPSDRGRREETDSIRFENQTSQRLALRPGEGGSVILSDLTRCIIDLRDTATSIHAEKLDQCILLAEVGGSVMLSSVSNSLLVLSCQQFRMHDSSSSTVMLDIPSHPIIEHSTSIIFGPNPLRGRVKGDAREINSRHADVQDFGWIKSGPSPNWQVASPDQIERIEQGVVSLLEKRSEAPTDDVDGDVSSLLDAASMSPFSATATDA